MQRHHKALNLLCLYVAIIPFKVEAMTHDLSIMLVVSYGQSGINTSGAITAADIALEDINNDPDVLPGYILTYDEVRDSEVSLAIS